MPMKLRIRQTELNPRSARIWLDDYEITSGLMGVTVSFDAVDVTTAELRIMVDELDLDAETLAVLQAHIEDKETATVGEGHG